VSVPRATFRALVIEHERATPAGLVYEWLDGRRAEVDAYLHAPHNG